MFGLAAGLYETYLAPVQLNVLLVGQESVGKTTLLERIRVTEFSKNPQSLQSQRSKRRMLICPAPGRYNSAGDEDDDDDDDYYEDSNAEDDCDGIIDATRDRDHDGDITHQIPLLVSNQTGESHNQPTRKVRNLAEEGNADPRGPGTTTTSRLSSSMEDIPINDDADDNDNDDANLRSSDTGQCQQQIPDAKEDWKQFDLKRGAKMLPKEKIRPTIGMNLAKLDLCRAKCHFWDLGGKMKDIRKRYYADADVVVCVVSIEEQHQEQLKQEEEQQQQSQFQLLEELKTEVGESIPVLIFVNHKQPAGTVTAGSPSQLAMIAAGAHLKKNRGASRLVSVMTGSAKSGQGVRAAFEWLIPLAKEQKRKRQQHQVVKDGNSTANTKTEAAEKAS